MEKGRNKFDKSLMKFGKNFIGVDDYRTYENRSDLYRRIVIVIFVHLEYVIYTIAVRQSLPF